MHDSECEKVVQVSLHRSVFIPMFPRACDCPMHRNVAQWATSPQPEYSCRRDEHVHHLNMWIWLEPTKRFCCCFSTIATGIAWIRWDCLYWPTGVVRTYSGSTTSWKKKDKLGAYHHLEKELELSKNKYHQYFHMSLTCCRLSSITVTGLEPSNWNMC